MVASHLIEALKRRAEVNPEKTAYVYLKNGEVEAEEQKGFFGKRKSYTLQNRV